ncbi:MAG: bifunctional isocitrate dehydrogenase kinase/phosphatase [Gammaproteobacteria bacterium]|nr:MAG: bifunctional isocitrate dehydrogenase kinase/phosphatase [Gammaproteobacteria bacterium]
MADAPAPMTDVDVPAVDRELVRSTAAAIVAAFARYNAEYRAITRRAPERFENRDWTGIQADVVERLELYSSMVRDTAAAMQQQLGTRAREISLWTGIRHEYAAQIAGLADPEFLKTFFSSITRRLFGTVGVDPAIEFFALELDPLRGITSHVVTNSYANRGSIELLFEQLLSDFRFRTPWRDFEGSVGHVAADVRLHLQREGLAGSIREVEVIRPVFYQMTRAYVVGRISGEGWVLPLAIAFRNTPRGVLVDAVMLRENDVSILFSFTRSYFHVDLERVGEAVLFLRSILPRKPVSELFTVLGRAKQGKTERFREIFRHLAETSDRFIRAPGERGLVMACFTCEKLDVVFKVIRDQFPAVKTILREEVIAKYDLVFRHDRGGRLVDAQEFRRVRLPRARFDPEMLDELTSECALSVQLDGDDVIVGHVYIERRLVPLNLYLRTATPEQAELAVIDYGQAIRDLAYTNIFAGDLLLKNFGVTRNSRVIFYDYDELCQVTDCRFRDLPEATSDEDEMRAESWFYVADNDVFPETFLKFLGFDERLRAVFLDKHGEILQAGWWRTLQQRLRRGEVVEVLPYHPFRVRVASSA